MTALGVLLESHEESAEMFVAMNVRTLVLPCGEGGWARARLVQCSRVNGETLTYGTALTLAWPALQGIAVLDRVVGSPSFPVKVQPPSPYRSRYRSPCCSLVRQGPTPLPPSCAKGVTFLTPRRPTGLPVPSHPARHR